MEMVRYWAVVTRGLEAVARDEIAEQVVDVQGLDIGYRRVSWSTAGGPASLLTLRTIDDLFIDIATWEGIDRRRFALPVLGEQARLLDLRDAASVVRQVRDLGTPPRFSVTANFVGRRNYSTDEIKLAVSSGIETSHGWEYQADDGLADLNLRVFMEHDRAYIGIRLGAAPLHERPYKQHTLPGSLKPTVAAAMVRIGRFPSGSLLADPVCGVGTIPIEAVLQNLQAIGGDISEEALAIAQLNAAQAGVNVTFHRWDARGTDLDDASVDGIVANLPWGRQIAVDDAMHDFYHQIVADMARIVRPGAQLVLLTSLQPLLRIAAAAAGLNPLQEIEISLSGQTPLISTLIRPA